MHLNVARRHGGTKLVSTPTCEVRRAKFPSCRRRGPECTREPGASATETFPAIPPGAPASRAPFTLPSRVGNRSTSISTSTSRSRHEERGELFAKQAALKLGPLRASDVATTIAGHARDRDCRRPSDRDAERRSDRRLPTPVHVVVMSTSRSPERERRPISSSTCRVCRTPSAAVGSSRTTMRRLQPTARPIAMHGAGPRRDPAHAVERRWFRRSRPDRGCASAGPHRLLVEPAEPPRAAPMTIGSRG